MLLGVALTKEDKTEKAGTVYVEYRKCDKCGVEYRLYYRSEALVEEAFQLLAKRMGNASRVQDLCFDCQQGVIAHQLMIPLKI